MAKNITQFSLFLSSPSDLEAERSEVPSLINELNLTYGSRQEIHLDVIKWETHTAPGISKTYTQDLINKDIGDNYDIFIGMLGLKFGTKTKIANSGTEEEFLRAIERFKKGENIQILFYFKTTPPISVDDINPQDLIKRNEFKNVLKQNNILFSDFSTIDELKNKLRIHIPMRIDELKANSSEHKEVLYVPSIHSRQEQVDENDDDEFGVIDFIFQFQNYLSDSTYALINISESTKKIGEDIQEKANEVVRISKHPNPKPHVIIEYFKRTAKVISTFSDRLELEIPNFYDNFEDAIKVGLRFVNSIDKHNIAENYDSLKENLISVVDLKGNIPNAINGMMRFHEEVKNLPHIQSDLNRSKKKLLGQLEDLIFKLKKSFELTNEFQGQIEYKIALIKK